MFAPINPIATSLNGVTIPPSVYTSQAPDILPPMSSRGRLVMGLIVLGALPGAGCVERTMTFTTTPPGSLVFLNGQEVGRTPLKRDFTWYGIYDVTIRKEGYETLKTTQEVAAPTYQLIPLDMIVEMLPVWFTDERHFDYTLYPSEDATGTVPSAGLVTRAEEMRK